MSKLKSWRCIVVLTDKITGVDEEIIMIIKGKTPGVCTSKIIYWVSDGGADYRIKSCVELQGPMQQALFTT